MLYQYNKKSREMLQQYAEDLTAMLADTTLEEQGRMKELLRMCKRIIAIPKTKAEPCVKCRKWLTFKEQWVKCPYCRTKANYDSATRREVREMIRLEKLQLANLDQDIIPSDGRTIDEYGY